MAYDGAVFKGTPYRDADGNQVGTALANTNHLKAGGSWKFEALGTVSPDQVASWERSDVSGF